MATQLAWMENIEKHVVEKVVLYTSLLIGVMTLIASIINILLRLNLNLIISVLLISIVYFLVFLFIKFRGINNSTKYFITIFSLAVINLTWYFNYFSKGPALGNFVLLYAFLLFIWDKKHAIFFSIFLFINLIGLMIFEYNNYPHLENYRMETSRIFDVYFGILLVLGMIHFYTSYLKTNYLKQYQNARKSDQLKSSFLANLSHEIRTPLNSIIGFSDLITSEDTSVKDRLLYNEIIQSNSNDLLALIEDVVDLSLIESDQIKLVKTEFSLNELLDSIYLEYTYVHRNDKPIAINYKKLNPDVAIFSDQLRVRQIIKNLLNNAIKYTNEGSINFGFSRSGEDAIFFISDTGRGIKKEDMNVIFNRFMKLENKSELYRGVGIGLHLSKRIAHLLGGDIWATSTYGHGSTFYFKLPC